MLIRVHSCSKLIFVVCIGIRSILVLYRANCILIQTFKENHIKSMLILVYKYSNLNMFNANHNANPFCFALLLLLIMDIITDNNKC